MFIVVVGAGAMGCLYGGQLKDQGHDVVLVDVWEEQIAKINRDGLRMDVGSVMKTIKIPAMKAEQVTGYADLIMVFTKTIHREKAIESTRHFTGPESIFLTVQNGIGNVEAIEKLVPRARIIAGVTDFPSDLVSPGHIVSRGSGHTLIMAADGIESPKLDMIRAAIDAAGLNCVVSPDVYAAIWQKLAFNAAMNSLTAVLRIRVGKIGEIDIAADLARRIACEVIAVANAKGIGAKEAVVLEMLENAMKHHVNHMPSMLQDVLAQRQTEIEAINGAVVREAELFNIPVPTTEVLYRLVKVVEQVIGHQCF